MVYVPENSCELLLAFKFYFHYLVCSELESKIEYDILLKIIFLSDGFYKGKFLPAEKNYKMYNVKGLTQLFKTNLNPKHENNKDHC